MDLEEARTLASDPQAAGINPLGLRNAAAFLLREVDRLRELAAGVPALRDRLNEIEGELAQDRARGLPYADATMTVTDLRRYVGSK